MTLKYKIFPLYSISIVVAIAIVFFPSWQMLKKNRLDQAKNDLSEILSVTRDSILSDSDMKDTEAISLKLDTLAKSLSARVTLIKSDGTVVFDSDASPSEMLKHNDRPETIAAAEKGFGESYRFSTTLKKNFLYSAAKIATPSGDNLILRISQSDDIIFKGVETSVKWLFTFCITAFVAGGLIIMLISGKINSPLSEIRKQAANFAKGDFSKTIHSCGIHEIDLVSDEIDRMAVELKKSLQSERKSLSELDTILSSMKESVVAIDAEGRIIKANKAAMSLFNIGTKGLSEKKFFYELIRNTETQNLLAELLENKSDIEREIEILCSKKTYLQARGNALVNADGKVVGALAVFNDVTKMKRLENMRKDFVSNVSHEIRTPLTAIIGAVETLLENDLKHKERDKMFAILSRHAQRLNTLVEDILSLSRIEQGSDELDLNPCSVSDVIEQAVDTCREKAENNKVKIEMDLQDFDWDMDPGLFQQALTNLIDNAIKFSDKGNKVRIKSVKNEKGLEISVSDEGCGMSPDHLPRIFERFYRVDKARSRELGGTGLGLAIVKHIINAHGGEVKAESSIGAGSTFTIKIPLEKK
ncbi:MAG TPA: ATP-binding protein [Victivallales bacterium]|nr:ATP-binding protein [Victivallales bacterium]